MMAIRLCQYEAVGEEPRGKTPREEHWYSTEHRSTQDRTVRKSHDQRLTKQATEDACYIVRRSLRQVWLYRTTL